MSIGILISVHDGIVLAADSASTLTLTNGHHFQSSGEKVLNLYKRHPIGCVPYGAGCIGDASISSLLREFRESIMHPADADFSVSTYTLERVAQRLSAFLMTFVAKLQPNQPKPSLGVLVGGYSAGQPLPETWQVTIEAGESKPVKQLRGMGEVGINWGGDGEAISRIVQGFSEKAAIPPELAKSLEVPLVFAPMPVHDAIELADWLTQTAIMYSRFTPGYASACGPVEIASITRFEGFKWIRRKHYYEKDMNPHS